MLGGALSDTAPPVLTVSVLEHGAIRGRGHDRRNLATVAAYCDGWQVRIESYEPDDD